MRRLFGPFDNRRPDSFASRLRRRRFDFFTRLTAPLPKPVRVLDVGGVEHFWRHAGVAGSADWEVVLLNLEPQPASAPNLSAVVGDGRDMAQFRDSEFDVVFSNSVIEHLREWPAQQRMAVEIQRVGKRFFVQTPNRWFPIEPHFLLPGFQFLPVSVRVALVRRFALGYHDALPRREDALQAVTEIRLLTAGELRRLFPGAEVYRERVAGLTKSLTAYGGWSA